jgi:hypothetical protein
MASEPADSESGIKVQESASRRHALTSGGLVALRLKLNMHSFDPTDCECQGQEIKTSLESKRLM